MCLSYVLVIWYIVYLHIHWWSEEYQHDVMLLLTFSAMATQHSSYEPLCRFGYAAVAVGSKVRRWGVGHKRNVQEVASNVEVFDVTTELWEQNSIHGTPPPGLSNTAYTVVGTSLYSFGGYNGKFLYNSLYQLDLHTLEWKQLVVRNPSSGPHRMCGSRMVSCGDNQLIVFAGRGNSGYSNELHIFNLDKDEPKFQWELGSNLCKFWRHLSCLV